MKPISILLLSSLALAVPAFAQTSQQAEREYLDQLVASDSTTIQSRRFMGRDVNAITPVGQSPANTNSWWSRVRVNGGLQTEFMVPLKDEAISSTEYEKPVLNNTYFDLTINAPYLSVGGRFEWAKWPLPSFTDAEYKGWGVPYIWATAYYKWARLTVGDFYEQFGSGLILRTYQERTMGIDNAIRGARLKLNPAPGLTVTALGGKQRRYWEHNSCWLWGGDVEWSLNESFARAFGSDYGLTLGASYLGKHEYDQEDIILQDNAHKIRFPRNIAAFDFRAKVRLKNVNILADFATKNNDPSADNNYTYRRGHAELLSLTYSSHGFSFLAQAKRSENMSYRSRSSVQDVTSYINHLPAFTLTQTYALAAMYPYATQPEGEWAFQAELRYLFKRYTPLGGKYGTSVRLSASYISALDKPFAGKNNSALNGTDGYGSAFWKIGSLNYADLNLEIYKKFSKKWQFTLFYLFQKYNQEVVEGHADDLDHPVITANIFVLEGQWKIAKKLQLRFEAQYLEAQGGKGDWVGGLVELSVAPHWMFTFSDTYNLGLTKLNYYNAVVTYTYKANRFSLGFGRTREGFDCSGGVCRWVPACKGFSLSYNYTF